MHLFYALLGDVAATLVVVLVALGALHLYGVQAHRDRLDGGFIFGGL